MKTPVVWVTAALTAAIVLTASFLIATGTRSENTPPASPSERVRASDSRAPDAVQRLFDGAPQSRDLHERSLRYGPA